MRECQVSRGGQAYPSWRRVHIKKGEKFIHLLAIEQQEPSLKSLMICSAVWVGSVGKMALGGTLADSQQQSGECPPEAISHTKWHCSTKKISRVNAMSSPVQYRSIMKAFQSARLRSLLQLVRSPLRSSRNRLWCLASDGSSESLEATTAPRVLKRSLCYERVKLVF